MGDAEDLPEMVGYVQHADARGGHRADPIEQIVDLVDGQSGRGLVENEQAGRVLRVLTQSARDGDAGALRGAES